MSEFAERSPVKDVSYDVGRKLKLKSSLISPVNFTRNREVYDFGGNFNPWPLRHS